VFDLSLSLEQAAEGYRAMDERSAIKTLLRPWREGLGWRRGSVTATSTPPPIAAPAGVSCDVANEDQAAAMV
jgi:hypothetical protein